MNISSLIPKLNSSGKKSVILRGYAPLNVLNFIIVDTVIFNNLFMSEFYFMYVAIATLILPRDDKF